MRGAVQGSLALVSPDADLMSRVMRVLEAIEGLPPTATGVARFGGRGTVLIDSRVICWATASGMQQRLTDLLRLQRNPPLDRATLSRVVRECRRDGRPLGEALLATGQITQCGLRAALSHQISEAVARIAAAPVEPIDFTALADVRYDRRFLFHPAEVLAALGGRWDRALAVVARRHLETVLDRQTPAFAFVRDGELRTPLVLAVQGGSGVRVGAVAELARWTRNQLDLGRCVGDSPVAMGGWAGASVVAWTWLGACFAAVCSVREAEALTARLVPALRRVEVAR